MERPYFLSSGILLGITGLIKVLSSFGSVPLLLEFDPVFELRNSVFYQVTGCLEIFICILLLSKCAGFVKALILLSLCTCFSLYRFGLAWMGVRKACPCLGNLTGWLGMSPHAAHVLATVILVYLSVGSVAFLVFRVIRNRGELASGILSRSTA
jgi:hypothetical protein